MRIEEMHWKLRLEYNEMANNHKKTFSDAEMDEVINMAIKEYKEIFFSGNNAKQYKIGFEVTQQRIDMLHTLVVGQPEQPIVSPTSVDTNLNIYEFKLDDLALTYAHFINASIKPSHCTDLYSFSLEEGGDINKALTNANTRPSNTWGRSLGRIRRSTDGIGKSLYVYTGGEFEIEGLYIEYLKEPAKVALGTYNEMPTLDNPTPGLRPQVHCDLPEDYHHLVVTIAAQEIARILLNVNSLRSHTDRVNKIV